MKKARLIPKYRPDSIQMIILVENANDFGEAVKDDEGAVWLDSFFEYWKARFPHLKRRDAKALEEEKETLAANTDENRALAEKERLRCWGLEVDVVFRHWLSMNQ
ncbi:hypothetical protein DFP72DRAFT_1058142 [Ephemerocybe angulata]|uniref:Uncharacterized protein n=1 Tax=Ephemerocybe angulata TaxID=980116 RepID=A0A8H6IJP3_9AGAR|nr:hypothetical protein DFP72DRAFT_1058142 [Tulosesus angulatus]